MRDEALKLALEALENHEGNYKLSDAGCDRHDKAITSIKQALAAQHEPENEPFVSLASVQEPVATIDSLEQEIYENTREFVSLNVMEWLLKRLNTTLPAAPVLEGRDWSLLEATQDSLREHMTEIKRLKEAQPAVPDAMHHTDMSKTLEYIQGWNACRQATLEMMK